MTKREKRIQLHQNNSVTNHSKISMKNYPYNYYIVNLSDGKEVGYQAIVPKFPGMYIFIDRPKDAHEIVMETIDVEYEERKRKGEAMPEPDIKPKFNGKVLLRMKPKMHEKLFYEAQANNISLNKYIESKLSSLV